MVEKVQAWQISTGQCFANKAEAFHEEMVWLLSTQADVNKRSFDVPTFERAIASQKNLLSELKDLRVKIGPKDLSIRKDLNQFIENVEAWLVQSESLHDKLDNPEQ